MHEGYTNFETWSIMFALNNDRDLYNLSRATVKQAKRDAKKAPQIKMGIWTSYQAELFILADTLKEFFETRAEDFDLPAPFADLLSGALSSVNWGEIAQELLEGKE